MRTLGGLLAVLCLALATAASGCGGEDEDEDRVEGDGYSYAVPDGWRDVSDRAEDEPGLEVAGIGPDTLVIGERKDDFATNVNVILEPGLPDELTSAEYGDITIAGLRDPAGAGFPPELVETIESIKPTDLSEPRDAELGDERAVAWDYTSLREGRPIEIRQVAAVVDETGFTVTLTVLPEHREEGLDALDEVTGSWRFE
jgi:hypothetical protein